MQTSPATNYNYRKISMQPQGYFPVSPLILFPDTCSDFQVYLKQNGRMVLYTREKERYTQQLRQKLHETGIDRVYVPASQIEHYQKYVHLHLSKILEDQNIPVQERAKTFLQTTTEMVKRIFQKKLPGGITQEELDHIVHLVTSSSKFLTLEEALRNINKLISHDYKTFSHCVHVFTYSMAIMNTYDRFSENDRQNTGIGAMLHDLGKSLIPQSVLNKPGRLSVQEWDMMQKHPIYGVRLCSNISLSDLSLKCILFHHEKYDGTGYPSGMQAENIPLPARILNCCDVYDAITSDRPYAPAENPFQALKTMKQNMRGSFDLEVLRRLITLLQDIKSV
ncbi:MAG: HD-GYP domain-containing protein [Thermodesulfobacteriota bacterium]